MQYKIIVTRTDDKPLTLSAEITLDENKPFSPTIFISNFDEVKDAVEGVDAGIRAIQDKYQDNLSPETEDEINALLNFMTVFQLDWVRAYRLYEDLMEESE